MITGTLRSEVDKLWNDFWTGGLSNPLLVIEQVTYLIFLRRLDEIQSLKEKKANRTGKPIENPIYSEVQKRLRWSSFKNEDPEVMLDLFTKPMIDDMSVFDFLKQLGSETSEFGKHMKGATFMISSARLLDKAVQTIDRIFEKEEFGLSSKDVKGDLYEYLLSKIASAGKNGQFRTPRHIIRMMVHMIKPTPKDTVCDPAMGTAGFLSAFGEYMDQYFHEDFHNEKFKKHYNNKMFTGIEFDPSMMRIGAMNLMLHGIEHPNLIPKDALSESNGGLKEEFSVILANPPFKGSLDKDVVDTSITKLVDSKKTELLFLGLMLRLMKIGGRAAVIVPDGVLFGSNKAHKQIRREIVENHQLQAVISMPGGVFKPYAGVSTAILLFTKTNSGGTDKVWFYDMKTDGFSLNDNRDPLITEEELEQSFTEPGKIVKEVEGKCDIADILMRWNQLDKEGKRERTTQSFMVPFEEIKENNWDLSINRYKEFVYEEIEYDTPDEIINGKKDEDGNDVPGIRQLTMQKLALLDELEKMI